MTTKTFRPQDPDLQKILKMIENMSGRYNKQTIFRDMVEMMALTISKESDSYRNQERSYDYDILLEKYYNKKEPASFHNMGQLQMQVMTTFLAHREAGDIIDVFGPLYSALNMDGKLGQFFTPWHISKMMAKMQIGNDDFAGDRYQSLCDPTCGAGGMFLAFAQCMNEIGEDYRHKLIVWGMDIDTTCAQMCYAQLALYQIPGIVNRGDSLKDPNGTADQWRTPAFFQYKWTERLAA